MRDRMRQFSSFVLLIGLSSGAVLLGQSGDGPPPKRPSLTERATKGDADAQFTLGKNYEAGRGGLQKDFVKAEHWYREAANQGEPFAQASLGILYRFGRQGVPQNLVEAYQWFSIAAAHTTGGDQDTIAEMRDSTAAKMSPEQLTEAKRRIQEWKPTPRASNP